MERCAADAVVDGSLLRRALLLGLLLVGFWLLLGTAAAQADEAGGHHRHAGQSPSAEAGRAAPHEVTRATAAVHDLAKHAVRHATSRAKSAPVHARRHVERAVETTGATVRRLDDVVAEGQRVVGEVTRRVTAVTGSVQQGLGELPTLRGSEPNGTSRHDSPTVQRHSADLAASSISVQRLSALQGMVHATAALSMSSRGADLPIVESGRTADSHAAPTAPASPPSPGCPATPGTGAQTTPLSATGTLSTALVPPASSCRALHEADGVPPRPALTPDSSPD